MGVIKAIAIDLDGTMIDTAPDFLGAVNKMCAKLYLNEVSLETVQTLIGKGPANLVRNILQRDMTDTQVMHCFEDALGHYQSSYETINGKFSSIYPNVVTGLQALTRQGFRLACVTNKPQKNAVSLLKQKGLRHYFELVYGGDSLPEKKPLPGPLLQVAKDFGIRPSELLVVGDSSNDAQAARAAGCPVFLVPYGYNHGHSVNEVDCDAIVDSLFHVSDLLNSHRQSQSPSLSLISPAPASLS